MGCEQRVTGIRWEGGWQGSEEHAVRGYANCSTLLLTFSHPLLPCEYRNCCYCCSTHELASPSTFIRLYTLLQPPGSCC